MSEPKLISPLLDNFIMGDPIANHNGIRCCPAMNQDTGDKFIVKIISLPATSTQLEAMILTGALKDDADATAYYESRAKDIVQNIEILNQLAKQDGFIPYGGYQIVPMEDRIGFDVYVLTAYRRTLERQFSKKPLTHLDALNLGMDICAALAACRRSGYLFTNLKPSNIFITENGQYKISDACFARLNNLMFSSIDDHQICDYTAPEISDAFSSLNSTVDVYAIGMILYTIYNGGEVPNKSETLAEPKYADEELSAILLKAINPAVEDRWQDPEQFGHALVQYMQKNGASDQLIVPPPQEEPSVDEELPAADEALSEDSQAEITEEDVDLLVAEIAAEDADTEQDTDETAAEPEIAGADAVQDSATEDEEVASIHPASEETDTTELTEISESEESVEETAEIPYGDISDEVSQILSQADELATMDVPEPVVAPKAIEIQLPEEATEETEAVTEDTLSAIAGIKAILDEDEPVEESEDVQQVYEQSDDNMEDEDEYEDEDEDEDDIVPSSGSHVLRNILIALAALAVLIGGFLFYKLYVLQTIDDLQLLGTKDQLTVQLNTATADEILTVTCADIYGHEITVPVVNGQAQFSGLSADSEYSITVNISGLHILKGKTFKNYFTDSKTQIVQCDVVTGNVEGTAIVSFVVDGPDSAEWIFTYIASDGDTKSVIFSGHSITLTDLVEGETYRGSLSPVNDIFLDEQNSVTQITFTPTGIVQASNLLITECIDDRLSVKWEAPENAVVENWTVRCYNGTDYDETLTVSDCLATFNGLNSADAFTIEVTAAGQSVSQSATIGPNAITVQNLSADTSQSGVITLRWDAATVPSGGWIVKYTLANSELEFEASAATNEVVINPAIPGSVYTFTVQAADGTTIACEPFVCTTDEAKDFQVNYHGNPVTTDNFHFSMCVRPTKANWNKDDVKSFTTRFKEGQNAAFLVFLDRKYDVSADPITTAFVICNARGNIISIESTTKAWSNMWYKNYCELDIPVLPEEAGNYTIYVYFNGQFANKQSFTVV